MDLMSCFSISNSILFIEHCLSPISGRGVDLACCIGAHYENYVMKRIKIEQFIYHHTHTHTHKENKKQHQDVPIKPPKTQMFDRAKRRKVHAVIEAIELLNQFCRKAHRMALLRNGAEAS